MCGSAVRRDGKAKFVVLTRRWPATCSNGQRGIGRFMQGWCDGRRAVWRISCGLSNRTNGPSLQMEGAYNLESALMNPPWWLLIQTPTGVSDRAVLIIRSRSSPMPSTSRAMTRSPPSSAIRSRELAAQGAVELSTIRYRKPFAPLPWGSTVTMSRRLSPLRSATLPPWMDKADVVGHCGVHGVLDPRQAAGTPNSAHNTRARRLRLSKLRADDARPSHDGLSKHA